MLIVPSQRSVLGRTERGLGEGGRGNTGVHFLGWVSRDWGTDLAVMRWWPRAEKTYLGCACFIPGKGKNFLVPMVVQQQARSLPRLIKHKSGLLLVLSNTFLA